MNIKAILYDSKGEKIDVPEGHSVLFGKDSYCFIKNDVSEETFVYRPDRLSKKTLENSEAIVETHREL